MDSLKGAITAVPSSFLWAILFAYLFRIPIPMGGYIDPFGEVSTYGIGIFDVVKAVSVAWLFYGVLGGFIILSAVGAIAGVLSGSIYSKSNTKNRMVLVWSCVASAIPVFVLSILDYIIGPW